MILTSSLDYSFRSEGATMNVPLIFLNVDCTRFKIGDAKLDSVTGVCSVIIVSINSLLLFYFQLLS